MGIGLGRASGAMLVAAGVVVGGAGTAVAQGSSWLWPECNPEVTMITMCYSPYFVESAPAGDLAMGYVGPKEVVVGEETGFTVDLSVKEPNWFESPRNLDILSVTHQAPRGFEFLGVEGYVNPRDYPDVLDVDTVVDPTTGQVTATAPTGHWTVPVTDMTEAYQLGTLHLTFKYRVTELALDGTSSMSFAGTLDGASLDGTATGTTRVTPDLSAFGS